MRHYWSYYLLVAFLLFIIPETIALATRRPENTLSEYIWRFEKLSLDQPVTQWSATHLLFAGAFTLTALWLIGHFGWGIWR